MAKYKSAMGVEIDIGQFIQKNEKAIAIGNARMNARGDKLGPGGKIVKTKEQIIQEYYENNPNAVQKVSLTKVEPISKQLAKQQVKMTPAIQEDAVEKYRKENPVGRKPKAQ